MSFKRHVPKLAGVLIVAGVAWLMVSVVRNFLDSPPPPPKKTLQQVTLLPPPPPKMEEKPPEPEIEPEQEEVKLDEPEPLDDLPEQASDEPPPGSDLGLDAEGGAGGDGFGLIGRKGGRGLLAGAGDPFTYYSSQVSREIENMLADSDLLRKQDYSVETHVWVDRSGRVYRAELATSTGNKKVDAMLVDTMQKVIATAPPPDMPLPIRFRISSRL